MIHQQYSLSLLWKTSCGRNMLMCLGQIWLYHWLGKTFLVWLWKNSGKCDIIFVLDNWLYIYIFRLRIQADWLQFLQSTDSSDVPAGGPVTREEFRRIALIVALAISNSREWCIQMLWTMFICLFVWVVTCHRWNRMGCYPFFWSCQECSPSC